MNEELTPEQELAVAELKRVLASFAVAIEGVRAADLQVVAAFRLAGIDVPVFVPNAVFENLFVAA